MHEGTAGISILRHEDILGAGKAERSATEISSVSFVEPGHSDLVTGSIQVQQVVAIGTPEARGPDVVPIRIELDQEHLVAPIVREGRAAEMGGAGELPSDNNLIAGVCSDGLGILIAEGAVFLGPQNIPERVHLDQEHVEPAHGSQRNGSEVRFEKEVARQIGIAGTIGNSTAGNERRTGLAVIETNSPESLGRVGVELRQEHIVRPGQQRAGSEVHGSVIPAGQQDVVTWIDGDIVRPDDGTCAAVAA